MNQTTYNIIVNRAKRRANRTEDKLGLTREALKEGSIKIEMALHRIDELEQELWDTGREPTESEG